MTTSTYKSRNFGHRLGNWTRRMLSKLNGFEIGVAQRAQSVIPRFGYTLTRAAFLLIKLAVLAALLLVSIYVAVFLFVLVIFVFVIRLLNPPVPVEIVGWSNEESVYEDDSDYGVWYDEIDKDGHRLFYPDHPIYNDD